MGWRMEDGGEEKDKSEKDGGEEKDEGESEDELNGMKMRSGG